MMHCPVCGGETRVRDTREQNKPQNAVRRTRQCRQCGQRFFSMETLSLARLKVRKRRGGIEVFNEDKLRTVLAKIIDDREPKKKELSEAALAQVLARLSERGGSAVGTAELAQIMMEVLRETAEIPFLRFASAYCFLEPGELRPPAPEPPRRSEDDRQLPLFK